MEAIAGLVIGLALGCLLTWLSLRGRAGAVRDLEQVADALLSRLRDSFRSVAGEALRDNTRQLVELADQTFGRLVEQARGDFVRERQAVEGLVLPLREALERYDRNVREMENAWREDQGSLKAMLSRLMQDTSRIASVLGNPRLRGRWGEITLRRVVEITGMSRYCDFEDQVAVSGDGEQLRPDLVVRLPGNRDLVVDAKVPLDAYYRAVEAPDEEGRKSALRQHVRAVRKHISDLAGRGYAKQFNTDGFVVMFVPAESIIAAAAEEDPNLVEDGMKAGVFLASPATLAVLLMVVERGWRQQRIAENVREVQRIGAEFFDRARKFVDHFWDLHRALTEAVNAYNRALGSWQSRFVPGAKKLMELGVVSAQEELKELGPVEVFPREPAGAPVEGP